MAAAGGGIASGEKASGGEGGGEVEVGEYVPKICAEAVFVDLGGCFEAGVME